MTTSIQHRGPDEDGLYIDGSVGLGFRRLAILDLSPAAHQPMLSEDGQQVLVFNGEIFNYVELRQELRALGHTFRSTGDTEVLLHSYQEWGQECLNKLNGMWAFVIYDLKKGMLFGARDRFGIKPSYCYSDENYVLLGSEIKAIRASGLYHGVTNWSIVSRFLLQSQLDQSSESFFSNIEQVPPGNSFELDLEGRWKLRRNWSLNSLPANIVNEPVQEFADKFEDAVKRRMRSDVPVGVCLSGGLDSTLRNGSIGESWREMRAYSLVHGADHWQLFQKYVRRTLRAEFRRVPTYRRLTRWKNRQSIRKNSWFTTELKELLTEDEPIDIDMRLDAVLRRSVEYTPLPLYLRIEDRNSSIRDIIERRYHLESNTSYNIRQIVQA